MSSQPANIPDEGPAFDISPQVVFRLGDELITDELQALVELVKNSYDASATQATVVIDTRAPVQDLTIPRELLATSPAEDEDGEPDRLTDGQGSGDEQSPPGTEGTPIQGDSSAEPPAQGWLEVRDDGDGMTREGLERGWLLISSSQKRAAKEEGRPNRIGRTPLGDKGLGRLGVLRLGLRVEIRTRPRDVAEEHILRFSRVDFQREDALSDIHPHYERRPLERRGSEWHVASPYEDDVACSSIEGKQGTTIRITGLINPAVWENPVELQDELLALISPFEQIDRFGLSVFIDEEPLPLADLAEARRDLATARWNFRFDGEELVVTGRFKLSFFKPSQANERLTRLWEEQIAPDRGAEYRRRLSEGPLRGVEPTAERAPYWLKVKLRARLADVPDPRASKRKADQDGKRPHWAQPGPFHGEIDNFDLSRDAELRVGGRQVFDALSAYREWVRGLRGMHVYRDGFGVRVGDDFLKLGTAFTGGASFYALRPANVVGFLAISARDNRQLQETTDREGFVANAPYRALEALLTWMVSRINFVQTQVGRALGDWADELLVLAPARPSERAAELAAGVARNAASTTRAISAAETVERTLRDLGGGGALLTPEQERDARRASEVFAELRALAQQWADLQRDLDHLVEGSKEVERERADLREQLSVAYQTVGLGIVAETVAHEMGNVTGRLLAEANAIAPQLKGDQHRPARALVSEVKRSVRAIRLHLRHLDPQLRYQRARREEIDVEQLVREVATFHASRFGDDGISVNVVADSFKIKANRGRVQQALDNLFINSEYWLGHGETADPHIEITIAPNTLTFEDNGPGIDPSLEPAIFEAFVSGRTGESGRGLGLFITRQVLRDDSASIYLGPPDPDGRRRAFVIDFSEAVAGS